jgi:cell division protein FtsL
MSQQDDSWIAHALRQAPWRTQTQATSLVLAMVVIVVVIGALYLAQASRTAAAGRRVQALEAQRQVLEQQNSQLRAEIAALRSVPRLIAEAEKLGYHVASVDEVEYVTLSSVPPPPPDIPTTSRSDVPALEVLRSQQAPVEEAPPTYDETLESWLAERFVPFRAWLREFMQTTFGNGGSVEEEAAP